MAGQVASGLISADAQRDSARMMRDAERQKLKYMQDAYAELSPYYQKLVEQMPAEQAFSALQQWSPTPLPEAFQYNKSVNEFLDPSIAYQTQVANEGLQAAQAASGGLMSGGALKELQSRGMQIGSLGYENARGAQERDRAFNYQDYTNQFGYARQANQDRYNQLTNLYNAASTNLSNLSNLRMGQATTTANLTGSAANYQAQANLAGSNGLANTIGAVTSPQNLGFLAQGIQDMDFSGAGANGQERLPYSSVPGWSSWNKVNQPIGNNNGMVAPDQIDWSIG